MELRGIKASFFYVSEVECKLIKTFYKLGIGEIHLIEVLPNKKRKMILRVK